MSNLTPKQKFAVKLLFAGIILSQLAAYAVAKGFREPYPALFMPNFTGTLTDKDGTVRIGDVKCKVTFQDGSIDWLGPDLLLAETGDAHRAYIMDHMFALPYIHPGFAEQGGLKQRLFPGRALSSLRAHQRTLDPESKAWVRQRLQTLYPSKSPGEIDFYWYQYVFNVNRTSSTPATELLGIREERLE